MMRGLVLSVLFLSLSAFSDAQSVRWTYQEDKQSDLEHVVKVLSQKTGLSLTPADFLLIEDRALATSQFRLYAQQAAGLPIRSQVLRTWTSLKDQSLIQAEAQVDARVASSRLQIFSQMPALSNQVTREKVFKIVRKQGDNKLVRGIEWKDEWQNGQVVRVVTVKASRGQHIVTLSRMTQEVVGYEYEEYPQADSGEVTAMANIYPIWEEYDEVPIAERVLSPLRYLSSKVKQVEGDPYVNLKDQQYLYAKMDPIKGMTEEGRKQGFWAMAYVRGLANQIFDMLPSVDNVFDGKGVLEGRYTTINFHPSVASVQGIEFALRSSPQFRPNWVEATGTNDWEMVPQAGLLGKPVGSAAELLARPAERLPDHNIVSYINSGFDEVQVYWAVTQLFDSLRSMGFTDPDLSTRQFHAYLYDPDISMRDNAYYTDDTINFTTYSPKSHNMARDNSTIWHELGHGVMDRLMGDNIVLADTGGLSEGMADFVAQLVINHVTSGNTFVGKEKLRIFNRTGFHLTNEVHDDGESYGGAMNDMLVAAMAAKGLVGLHQVTDLTLEAMRLTRNHPGLTANGWFEHMLFADEMGNLPLRNPGELRDLVLTALAGRNFSLEGVAPAKFKLLNADQEVTATGPGSRPQPIPVRLAANATKQVTLSAKLEDSATYQFHYPVTVKVQLRNGPLQGAIHWQEESDKPLEFVIEKAEDMAKFNLTATGVCDEVNRPDGSCVDFAYVQIWNAGETQKPQAKKRFYLRVFPE